MLGKEGPDVLDTVYLLIGALYAAAAVLWRIVLRK